MSIVHGNYNTDHIFQENYSWEFGIFSFLPDLSHFGAPFANDTANEFIGDCHLMGLLLGRVPVLSSQ